MTERISSELPHRVRNLQFLLPGLEIVSGVFRELHREISIEEFADQSAQVSVAAQSQPLAISEPVQVPTEK